MHGQRENRSGNAVNRVVGRTKHDAQQTRKHTKHSTRTAQTDDRRRSGWHKRRGGGLAGVSKEPTCIRQASLASFDGRGRGTLRFAGSCARSRFQHGSIATVLCASSLPLHNRSPPLMRAALTWHRAGGWAGQMRAPGCCRRGKQGKPAHRRSELQRLTQAAQPKRD